MTIIFLLSQTQYVSLYASLWLIFACFLEVSDVTRHCVYDSPTSLSTTIHCHCCHIPTLVIFSFQVMIRLTVIDNHVCGSVPPSKHL